MTEPNPFKPPAELDTSRARAKAIRLGDFFLGFSLFVLCGLPATLLSTWNGTPFGTLLYVAMVLAAGTLIPARIQRSTRFLFIVAGLGVVSFVLVNLLIL
ncbi:MAG: hypothetical protein AAGI63_19795 [Planctomycetota bacterium]